MKCKNNHDITCLVAHSLIIGFGLAVMLCKCCTCRYKKLLKEKEELKAEKEKGEDIEEKAEDLTGFVIGKKKIDEYLGDTITEDEEELEDVTVPGDAEYDVDEPEHEEPDGRYEGFKVD